jgi:hypothetical protein
LSILFVLPTARLISGENKLLVSEEGEVELMSLSTDFLHDIMLRISVIIPHIFVSTLVFLFLFSEVKIK